MVDVSEPKPFEIYGSGVLLHGTKADLTVGDLLVPGRLSNFGVGRTANHVYVTATLDAATWGAELAAGEGRGRIYIVEPLGALEDDPNVTDKKFSGNPTRSYRTREPVKVVGGSPGLDRTLFRSIASHARRPCRPRAPGSCHHLRLDTVATAG